MLRTTDTGRVLDLYVTSEEAGEIHKYLYDSNLSLDNFLVFHQGCAGDVTAFGSQLLHLRITESQVGTFTFNSLCQLCGTWKEYNKFAITRDLGYRRSL